MIVAWTDDGWNDYVYWYDDGDYKKVSRINDLVKDMKRHPFTGIGKPELKEKSIRVMVKTNRFEKSDRL